MIQAYGALLAVIFVSLTFQLAAPNEDWAWIVTFLLQAGALLLALRVSRTRALLSRRATIAVLIGTALALLALIGVDQVTGGPARAISAAVIAFAIVAIALGALVEAREHGGINLRTVFGVLCIYLLMGMLFSDAFELIDILSSSPFFAEVSNPAPNDFLYFSYVTLTTTGYGDLTAATDVGRSVAVAEARIGQIYLVTIVALIVANLGRAASRPGRSPA